ncbi:MAG TPA: nucleotide sugar dehydrogenase [Candidatus Limnocylindrales bacterium]|nr:nucleotide sugar dehydrogenase [Candidatus Limnocylindrales bacterium]
MTSVGIFGLGYVGTVMAACLADAGCEVVGVDVNPRKVELIATGRSPIVEPEVDELVARGVASGRLRATTDTAEAVRSTSLSLICVGTPSNPNGSLDLSAVRRVVEGIGRALAGTDRDHVVVLRSTVLPGTTEEVVIPILEAASGRRVGIDLGVCYNPEFLREGTSVRDFRNPPFTVIGGPDETANARLARLYDTVDAPLVTTGYRVAEMLKYASNAFHALKVAFANEIGRLCKASGVDSHELMELFCRDTKLNVSAAYLKPGFAFGGSCLPKDLRALLHHGHSHDIYPPVLEAILPSNEAQIELVFQLVRQAGSKRVGVLGFSFKAGTDDLRESPLVELIERLIGKGYDVRVYDRSVSLANLVGSNREYIEREVPHIAALMAETVDEVLEHGDVIVIGNGAPEFSTVPGRLREGQRVIDLVRVAPGLRSDGRAYEGISW